jgi:putative membrane protein insertion efficiency factor
MSPAARLLLGLVRGYQLLVSPLLPSACRYYPTCSRYAAEALEHYGASRGAALAVRRVLRCHPWGGHGYDPVPVDAPGKAGTLPAPAGSSLASGPESLR